MFGNSTRIKLGSGSVSVPTRSANLVQNKFVVRPLKKQSLPRNGICICSQMRASDSSNKNQRNMINYGVQNGTFVQNSTEDQLGDLDMGLDLDIAPGAGGKKQFPSDVEEEDIPENIQKEGHMLNSTKECYEAFPFLIKASCPLNVPQDNTPTGDTLSTCPDAGPGTGKRRFPSDLDVDRNSEQQQRSNHLNTIEDNLREVEIRRSC